MRASSIALLACFVAAGQATAAEQLNIRPGSWEITSTTHMSGMPLPKEMLEKMSPQQRAEFEASLREEARKKPTAETDLTCITQEEVEQPFKSSSIDEEKCTQSLVQTSRTTQELRFTCTGERAGEGVLKITAPNPKTMTATFNLRSGEGPDPFMINTQMSGRWLSDECEEEDEDYEDSDDDYSPEEFDEDESLEENQ